MRVDAPFPSDVGAPRGLGRSRRPGASAIAAASILLALAGPPGSLGRPPEPDGGGSGSVPLGADARVCLRAGRDLEVEMTPAAGESWEEIAARYTGSAARAAALAHRNEGGSPSPDRVVRIPFALLGDDVRVVVLRNVFPRDRRENGDWVHVAKSGALAMPDEGLWQVALWFTGRGESYVRIAEANGLASPELSPGQEIRIPASMLHPSLRARPRSEDGALEYGEDREGPFAGYRLKAGEALYSAVVVRFTGRTDPEDVRSVAARLAVRSGIRDVKDIPVAWLVKIPLDLLEPEFLPEDHPRRREAEQAKQRMAEELAREPVRSTRQGLDGVVVILDPGHGGRDPGATANGVRESDHVHDIACRLRRLLEEETSAVVRTTMEGGPCASEDGRARPNGTIATHPPFAIEHEGESSIGVHLRWYLANAMLAQAVRDGAEAGRVVFLSLHADSRHPSLRGAMVYVPGESLRRGSMGSKGAAFRRYREYAERPTVRFTRRERVRSEAVSRKLASCVVEALREEELPVQPFKPVRDRVIRGRSVFLPAVLRGNAVPAKILVEVANLGNERDAALLARPEEREKIARALRAALLSYFSEPRAAKPRPAPPLP